MPPFLQFIIRRVLAIPVTLIVITMLLYAGVMLTPPEARVSLYYQPDPTRITQEQFERSIQAKIRAFRLDEPFLVQYGIWVKSLFNGTWGFSPTLNDDVLPSLLRRTPATVELTLFSLLLFIPLGLFGGVLAGWRQRKAFDNSVRFMAYVATAFPPFILSLMLLSIFYVKFKFVGPGRLNLVYGAQIMDESYRTITGLFTIDSLLNGRFDIFVDSLKHLILPVFTLSLYHWATLARITRSTIISERHKDYLVAAQARGLPESRVMWGHAFRNTLAPSFTSMALSSASLVTGVFVVEVIFNIKGISDVIVRGTVGIPDAPAALGFALYSVIIVLLLMFVFDVLQAVFSPRLREDLFKS